MKLVIFDPAGNAHFSVLNQLLECPLTKRRPSGAYLVPCPDTAQRTCPDTLEVLDYTGRPADTAQFEGAVVLTFAYAYNEVRALLESAECLVLVDQQRAVDALELMELGASGCGRLRVIVVETSAILTASLRAALALPPGTYLDVQ